MQLKSSNAHVFLRENYTFPCFDFMKFRNLKHEILITLKRTCKKGICPECGKKADVKKLERKKVRDLDLIKPCYIEFEQAKIECECGYSGYEKIDFISKDRGQTRRFEKRLSFIAL